MYFSGWLRLSYYIPRRMRAGLFNIPDKRTTMTDASFIARLQRHDSAAYDALVAQYGDVLYRYLYHSTHDDQQSEALLNATFLRVVERIASYRADGPPFVVWLHRIAHTVMRDTFAPAPPTIHADQSLDQLSLDERQVLLLRCVAGMSASEVGYILAKSSDAVKQLHVQALRRMYTVLK
jgi:RNA polymerase sigma-70 factor, ECF subfamily